MYIFTFEGSIDKINESLNGLFSGFIQKVSLELNYCDAISV